MEISRVFGVWYGGHGYSYGTATEDMETWSSFDAMVNSLADRYSIGYWSADTRANKTHYNKETGEYTVLAERAGLLTPAVGETCTIDLYIATWVIGDTYVISEEPYKRIGLEFNDNGYVIGHTEESY